MSTGKPVTVVIGERKGKVTAKRAKSGKRFSRNAAVLWQLQRQVKTQNSRALSRLIRILTGKDHAGDWLCQFRRNYSNQTLVFCEKGFLYFENNDFVKLEARCIYRWLLSKLRLLHSAFPQGVPWKIVKQLHVLCDRGGWYQLVLLIMSGLVGLLLIVVILGTLIATCPWQSLHNR